MSVTFTPASETEMIPVCETILIIDFGSQMAQLIARRVRAAGVYCDMVSYDKAQEAFQRLKPKGIILSGSPSSTLDENAPEIPEAFYHAQIPILGICYGQQLMCKQLGGAVERGPKREYGPAALTIEEESAIFSDFWQKGHNYSVWMNHGDRVSALPEGFRQLASSKTSPFAAISDEKRKFYGVQFHPEVMHTPDGEKLLANFVHKIVGIKTAWRIEAYSQNAIAKIQKLVGTQNVICGLSGGVDSAVTAVLVHKAVKDRLTCIFVDHGLLRRNEAQEVIELFKNHYKIPLIHIEAQERFLSALKAITDPEEKRKIIGSLFIEIFEEEAKKIGDAKFLAQGTLYSDVIESSSCSDSPSVTIKSHHNVGGLPEKMQLKLVEPLRELFKDEVRVLGRELGLAKGFLERHPFPGPGLAIRCLGEVTAEKLSILQDVDAIYLEEIKKAELYNDIWQAFAVLLPVKTVGVMGEARSYAYVAALRAVTSIDGMTADFYPHEMKFLGKVSTRIVNEVRGINRVVYDITPKPPSTVEWE